MNRRTIVVVVGFLTLLATLSSCAGPSRLYIPPDPLQGIQTFRGDRNEVWTALVGVIAEAGTPVQVIEKESGLITTQPVMFSEGLGSGHTLKRVASIPPTASSFAVWSMARYTLSFHVRSVTDSTTILRVTPHIEAYDSNVGKRWYVCESNGAIEAKLFIQIGDKLNR